MVCTFAEPKPKFCCQNLQQTKTNNIHVLLMPGGSSLVSLVVGGGSNFSNVWWLSLIRGFTTVREMKTTPL